MWLKHYHEKCAAVHVWDFEDRKDFIAVAEKQLSDKNVYKETNFKHKILLQLAETNNDIFKSLR